MEGVSLRERMADSIRASASELALLAVLGVAILGSGLFVLLKTSDPPAPPLERAAAPGDDAAASPETSPSPQLLVVHVAGQVANPGVYRLADGSRVQDALTAAGGPNDQADVDALNLASRVADGQKVFVPQPGEALPAEQAAELAGAAGGNGAAGGKINLNTASRQQLESLPSVGPVKAERIIAHRQAHGPFTSPRQIMEVSGFGPKTYEALKDLITV